MKGQERLWQKFLRKKIRTTTPTPAPVAWQPVIFLLHKSSHSFCGMSAPAVIIMPKRRALFRVSDCDSCTYFGSAWLMNSLFKIARLLKSVTPTHVLGASVALLWEWGTCTAVHGFYLSNTRASCSAPRPPAVAVHMLLRHSFWQDTKTFKRQGGCRLLTLIWNKWTSRKSSTANFSSVDIPDFLNPFYFVLPSASSEIRLKARLQAGLRHRGKGMTFGFGNFVLPFASLPDGTIFFSSPVFPSHLQICAHHPSPVPWNSHSCTCPLYYMCQALSSLSLTTIHPPHHTSTSSPWLELKLK